MRKNKKRKVAFILTLVLMLGYMHPIVGQASDDTLTKIEVLTQPENMEYCVGDVFDTAGLTLLATYSSGTTKNISDNYTTDYDFSASGEKVVTITYSEGEVSVETTVTVNVYKNPELITENMSVVKGSTVTIPVSISNNCGLMGMQLEIEYDNTCLLPISVEGTDIFTTGEVNDSIETSQGNTFHVIWAGSENMDSNGKLFNMTFYCKEDTEVDETSVHISTVKNNTYTEKYSPISCIAADSVITIDTKVNPDKLLLKELTVVVNDWEQGGVASIPKVSGNLGNGEITYYYAATAQGRYTTQMPSTVGRYYLRIKVDETEEYNSGYATCSFQITEPKGKDSVQAGNNLTTTSQPAYTTTLQPTYTTKVEYKKIKVGKPIIKSVKNVKGKKVVVKIKSKVTGASGYEIKYSNKKNSKTAVIISCAGNKLSNIIPKLKRGKTYYFSVRTYKKVDGEIYYSGWSTKKKVKIKK